MSLKGGHLSTTFLYSLQRPHEILGLEPTALILSCCSKLKTPDDFKDFNIR